MFVCDKIMPLNICNNIYQKNKKYL